MIELSDTAFYPDQIHRLSRMRILMGVHGAGVGNMIWMAPEQGGVVEIMVSQGRIERGREGSICLPFTHGSMSGVHGTNGQISWG